MSMFRRRLANEHDPVERIVRCAKRQRIAVFVIDDGAIEWPVLVETRLDQPCEIGSLTKVLSGLLLATAAADGRSSVDRSVAEALGLREPVEVDGAPITLGDLATHHAGVPRLPRGLVPADHRDPYHDTTSDMVVQWFVDWARTDAAAASRVYDYSNFGYAVLGEALARSLQARWADAVDQMLLDLVDGGVWASRSPHRDGDLAPARNSRARSVPHWHLGGFAPAGAAIATPEAMGRLAQRLLDAVRDPGDRFHDAVVISMEPHRSLDERRAVGLGWQISHDAGGDIVWHNGATGGSVAFLALRPAAGRAVGMLASGAPDDELEMLVASLLEPSLRSVGRT